MLENVLWNSLFGAAPLSACSVAAFFCVCCFHCCAVACFAFFALFSEFAAFKEFAALFRTLLVFAALFAAAVAWHRTAPFRVIGRHCLLQAC